jgi:GTP-binding protein
VVTVTEHASAGGGNSNGEDSDGGDFDAGDYDGEDFWADAGDPGEAGDGGPGVRVPVLAVVGRPNVGKSTLVNRILGSRQAVVQDVPGVTRDRVTYDASWRGRAFTVVDTGGWEPFPGAAEGQQRRELAEQVTAQARVAVEAADAVLFVLDAIVGVTDADDAVAAVLRRAGKPVVVAANKVDDTIAEPAAAALWSLGLGEPQPVSALHGRGSGDLLDAVLDALPETPSERIGESGGPRRVALIGRPNVGKSSLLNKLAGQTRVLVDEVAGTTRDPVDELIELGGTTWRFVDTAGIRRRANQNQGADFYAALRTAGALERAEVAVVLVDASEPLTEQDLRIISMVIDAGRALVIAYNKWDLVDEDRRLQLDREIDRQLHTARWAPRVNISAVTGRHVDRLVPAIEQALESWETRVPTGRLNAWVNEVTAATPPPSRGGRQPRIMFATQAGIRPPHFVLFTTGFLEAGYRRFLERRLREEFGFEGSPIRLSLRLRERRSSGGRGGGPPRREARARARRED